MSSNELSEQFSKIVVKINQLEQNYHRKPGSVRLLAVSKRHSIEAIQTLFSLGQHDFGENFLNEALPKIAALGALPIRWHYIGALQTNKLKTIAQKFDWVHSVKRTQEIEKLAANRPYDKPPLQICLQLKIDLNTTKSGASFEDVEDLILTCLKYPNQITLRGFMGLPPLTQSFAEQLANYKPLCDLYQNYCETYHFDTLCIGSSDDYEAAIKMGSTFIRLGTILFGERIQ